MSLRPKLEDSVQRDVLGYFFKMLVLLSLLIDTASLAGNLTVRVGPPSVGSGGSNPVSIPPLNPTEYEVTYLSKNNFESNIAITPGLLFGKRSVIFSCMYVSFGGGLVINANGVGPGGYTSVGCDVGQNWKFNAEYKKALGLNLSGKSIISPYAIRLGVTIPI